MRPVGLLAFMPGLLALGLALLAAARADESTPQAERTVYAWFPREFGNWDTRALDWSALTHVCFRSVELQPDGTLKEVVKRADVKEFVAEAHRHGVKVTVLVWGTNAAGSSNYLAHHAQQAVQSLLDYVKANNLDGINMDDETWASTNAAPGQPNRELVTQFFALLRKAFKDARPDYHITWASPPVVNPQDKYAEAWPDYAAIADLIDGFAIMSYCMDPPTSGWTGSSQPVDGGGKVNGHARDYATCIRDYLAATGGRANRLLLGMDNSLGGTEWTCRDDKPLSAIIGKPRRLSPAEARANAQTYGRRFDPLQKAPWYCHQEGDNWVQGWYQDEESLAAKLELARACGLQGICIWVLDGAHEPTSTFELLRRYRSGADLPARPAKL